MKFSTQLAWRFLGTPKSPVVLVVSVLAIGGIAIGVLVMNVTLAVMNGFRDEIQLRFVESMPMVTVLSWDASALESVDPLLEKVDELDEVLGAAPFLRQPAVFTRSRPGLRPRHQNGIVWGIDPERQFTVTPINTSISPEFRDFSPPDLTGPGKDLPGVVLGVELAASLNAGYGDVVTLTVPVGQTARLTDLEAGSRDFAIVGIVETGMFDFDATFAYVDLAEAQTLCERPYVDGIGLKIHSVMQATEIADEIAEVLGPPYWTNDWIRLNSQLFEWIAMEKMLMFLLLGLMTVVSVFAVIAILTMIVRDRQYDIAVLRSFGASRSQIAAIFLQVGSLLGAMGVLSGTALAMAVVFYLQAVGLSFPGEVYFVDEIPAVVRWQDVGLIALVSMVFALLATVLPSRIAANFQPVDVLRHE